MMFVVALALTPFLLSAQELVPETVTVERAVVRTILSETTNPIPGTSVSAVVQKLQVEILTGRSTGEIVIFENDYLPLKEGQRFFLRHETSPFHTSDVYAVLEPDRTLVLSVSVVCFLFLLFLIGGKQGIRGLLTLVASIAIIIWVLFPGLLKGYSPILLSTLVSSIIVLVGAYVTHGWNRATTASVVGMISTLIATGVLSHVFIEAGQFSGMSSEESVYLNFDTSGILNFRGLLLGGILIGLLGVLYDAAISQAIAVEELLRAGIHDKILLFTRAMRMGREHIGALVNTLAIAYVGTSLPLLLLFYHSSSNVLASLNRELFAEEIIRTMVGGSGVLLAIPITTIAAIFLMTQKSLKKIKD
jgi:uncharacterized membrane protein